MMTIVYMTLTVMMFRGDLKNMVIFVTLKVINLGQNVDDNDEKSNDNLVTNVPMHGVADYMPNRLHL